MNDEAGQKARPVTVFGGSLALLDVMLSISSSIWDSGLFRGFWSLHVRFWGSQSRLKGKVVREIPRTKLMLRSKMLRSIDRSTNSTLSGQNVRASLD